MTLNNLLGSLLVQLYKHLKLSDGIETLLSKADMGSKEELSRSEMREGIKSVLTQLRSTFIVIDGLDECSHFEDRQFEDFCRFLADIANTVDPSVSAKLVVLSRPDYKAIEGTLSEFSQINLDSGINDQDIHMYISHMVDEINSDPTPEEREGLMDIKETMFRHAGGLFLWVHFKAKQFREIGAVEDIKEALQEPTEGLDDLYGGEIRKILNHSSRFVLGRAIRALLWVANAYCALSKEMLLEALAIKPNITSLDQCRRLPRDLSLSTECADLINEEHGFYRLRHASLRDFLLTDLPGLEAFTCLQRQAHLLLADTCLTYINLNHFRSTSVRSYDELEALQEQYPLLEYAASFWGQHLAEVKPVARLKLKDLVTRALQNEAAVRLTIQTRHIEDFDRKLCPDGTTTPLHVLAVFNLTDIANDMPESRSYLRSIDGFGRLPIEYAVLNSCKEMAIWLLEVSRDMANDHDSFDLSFLCTIKSALLHDAAARDLDEVLRYLISLGLDQNTSLMAGRTPLHQAIISRSRRAVGCLLELGALPDVVADNYDTPLLAAARCGDPDMVRTLLSHRVKIDQRGEQEETALHWAVLHGAVSMASDLLNHGADPNARLLIEHKFWLTPFHVAIRYGSIKMMTILMNHGANINASCATQATWSEEAPIHLAIRLGLFDVAEALIHAGADLEIYSSCGHTPFLLACHEGPAHLARVILQAGADAAAVQPLTGCNGIHLAARKGHCVLIEFLLKHVDSHELMNAEDLKGKRPLHHAAEKGHTSVVKLLLENGAIVDAQSTAGDTPLHLATSCNQPNTAMLLLRVYSANAFQRDSDGRRPIHHIALHGLLELLPFVSCTTKKQLFDFHGFSPLHYAAEGDQADIISHLMATFPDLNVADASKHGGLTALHMAAIRGSLRVVKYLTSIHPSSPYVKNCSSGLPLHHAAEKGHLSCLKILLTPDTIDSCDERGATALWLASKGGHQAVVEYLIFEGADVNKPDNIGVSPALAAFMENKIQVLTFLLDYGADQWTTTRNGWNLLLHAARYGPGDIVERLLTSGDRRLSGLVNLETVLSCVFWCGRSEVIRPFFQKRVFDHLKLDELAWNPVHAAVQVVTPQTFQQVALEFPTFVHKADEAGQDAMFYAAAHGRVDMIGPLCDMGLSIRESKHKAMSPLETALHFGFVGFAQEAIARGARLQPETTASWTSWKKSSLHLATSLRKPRVMKFLLKNGADPTKKDWLGLTPLDFALQNNLLLEEFDPWISSGAYAPQDAAVTSQNARSAIRLLLNSSNLRNNINDTNPLRRELLNCLAEALLFVRTESSILKARLCHIEIAARFDNNISCDFCLKDCLWKGHQCTVCLNMDLCETCYQDYCAASPPKTIPSHVTALKYLEYDIFPVLEVLEVFRRRDVRELPRCLAVLGKLANAWAEARHETYARWVQNSQSRTTWSPQAVPSWGIVELIMNLDNEWFDPQTSDLKDENQSERLGYIRHEIGRIYDSINLGEDHGLPSCNGHDYFEFLPHIRLTEELRCHFDSEGVLRAEFFQGLVDEFSTSSNTNDAGVLVKAPADGSQAFEEKQKPWEGLNSLHPKSKLPGRNEKQVTQIGSRLIEEVISLVEQRDCLRAESKDTQDLDTSIETYEIAWKLAHAMLGVTFTGQLTEIRP